MYLCSALQCLSIYKWSRHIHFLLIFLLFMFNYQKKILYFPEIPGQEVLAIDTCQLLWILIVGLLFRVPVFIYSKFLTTYFTCLCTFSLFLTLLFADCCNLWWQRDFISASDMNVVSKLESMFVCSNKLPN